MIWLWVLLSCQIAWLPPGQGVYHTLSATWFTAALKRTDAYFGYSVTYEPTSKRLIVGAPKGDDIGEIYSCEIDNRVCTSVPKKVKRNNSDKYNHTYWLGAVVKAGPSYFVTCAPLSIDVKQVKNNNGMKNSFGTFSRCYRYTKPTELPVTIKSLSDNDRKPDTYLFEHTMDSLGWSIDVADDNIIIGGPAMFTGRAVKSYDVSKDPVGLTGINADPNKRVHYNFGYSVVAGYFSTAGKQTLRYAVGSPYGRSGFGTVSFYTSYRNTDMHHNGVLISSDESAVGSMFGAVLCAARLTPRSNTTALVIGAPTYATKHSFNLGAVYIYAAGKLPLSEQIAKIVGQQDGGFFGSAIVSVGDLNGDGRDEIAIGAPYEDSGAGAVYLYSVREVVSGKAQVDRLQRIAPEPAARAFGLSLTAVQDYDENGCNELAIGAPETNKVMLLRCIASVTVQLYEEIPDLRILKGKENSHRNNTHFEFQSCLLTIYPNKPKLVNAQIKVQVQLNHPHAKLANPKDKEYDVFLDRNEALKCRNIVVKTPEGGNYDLAIMYKIKATQHNQPSGSKTFDPQNVALSDLSQTSSSGSIMIAECSDTNNCMPKLEYVNTQVYASEPYVTGSTKTIEIDATVRNVGEVAYDPCLRLAFENVAASRVPPDCERVGSALKCAPKQTLRTDNVWGTQNISLDVTHLTNKQDHISIHIKMYNRCTKNEFETITRNISLIPSSIGIFIKGVTDAGLDDMVNITKNEVALGKAFEHSYTISNSGPTNWEYVTAKLVLQKRSFIENSTIILSLDSLPLGPQSCDFEGENDREAIFSCKIERLFKNDGSVKITVPFFLKPGTLEKAIAEKQNTVYTILTIDFDGTTKSSSVNSVLILKGANVPLWIILAASIIGLIILLIIFFILRECGFFRRETKENLEKVRRSVKRQTIMRRSMMDGVRLPPGPDRESLIAPEPKESTKEDRRVHLDDPTAT